LKAGARAFTNLRSRAIEVDARLTEVEKERKCSTEAAFENAQLKPLFAGVKSEIYLDPSVLSGGGRLDVLSLGSAVKWDGA